MLTFDFDWDQAEQCSLILIVAALKGPYMLLKVVSNRVHDLPMATTFLVFLDNRSAEEITENV